MAFFDRYANFVPDPQANLVEEFARLAVATGMNPCGATYRRRRREFFIEEFNLHWGTDGTKLKIWQRLCREVRIDPVPVSITQCKKVFIVVLLLLIDRT
ncbi:MAG: hypothetical protein M1827_004901 [Pycnora praestabilis]|nr:MAG: hypothetical protein M1827_004901 [Pycnora praestabilis]